MARKAVVLGGGGGTGVAWEIGIVFGLRQAGINLNDADLIVGTSAGANVGAQIRLGRNFVQLYQAQVELGAVGGRSPVRVSDPAVQAQMRRLLDTDEDVTEDLRCEIGRLASQAKAQPAEDFVAPLVRNLGGDWPEQPFKATGVDVEDGSVVAFDRRSGIPLGRAVAISMCVPGMVQPVEAGGRRYMDGGMNGDNLHLAEGFEAVLVIATRSRARTERAVERLRASGSTVIYGQPDAASLEALGEDDQRFSVARRGPSAEQGARQGVALAEQLRPIWS